MATDRRLFMGPSLRRLRRDLGLTQADMAADLEVSASYIALLERNHRPLTAEMLLRLAQTYKIDMADLAGDGGADDTARLQAVLKDPMFADIDLPALEIADVATNYPGITEALLRLYTAYREEQLALADRGRRRRGRARPGRRRPIRWRKSGGSWRRGATASPASTTRPSGWPRRVRPDGIHRRLKARHDLRVRRLPPDVMVGSTRRLDRHRREILLDDELDTASQTFQLALQLAYLEMDDEIDAVLEAGQFATESGERLTRRALASYAAAALLMPYSAFARAVETRRYDVEALAPPVRRQLRADRPPADHPAEAGPGAGAVLLHPRRRGRQRLQAAGRRGLSLRPPRRRLSAVVGAPRLPHAAPDRHPVAGAARRPAVLLHRPHGDRRRRAFGAPGRARHRAGLRGRACRPADLHPRRRGAARRGRRRSASPAASATAPVRGALGASDTRSPDDLMGRVVAWKSQPDCHLVTAG